MTSFRTVNLLNLPFAATTEDQVVAWLADRASTRQNTFVVTANPEIAMFARQHPDYQKILQSADLITADGTGIVMGAKIQGHPLPERVTGFDTMQRLLQVANERHQSVYFVGAKPAVINALRPKIEQDYPNLLIAGMHDGYFEDDAEIAEAIRGGQPDYIFAALGFPKQEQFIHRYRHVSDSVWMGVGGSFDVLAGMVARAPEFWQKHHLEWVYRVLKQPSRFKRLLIIPPYLWHVIFNRNKKDYRN